MKKLRVIATILLLLICLTMFGAWSYALDEEEPRYADAPLIVTQLSETVNYTRREIAQTGRTDHDCPMYTQVSGLTNACGAVAGSEIVAFYDKYCPDLIYDWDSYLSSGRYRAQDYTYVPALMQELYALMRTNVDDVGVSRTDFLTGLAAYVKNHGYNISTQSVMSGSTVSFTKCKNAIDNNKLIVLFTSPINVYTLNTGTTSDIITSVNIASSHIMVVYGYHQINYYNDSGIFRTDTYLRVAVGKTELESALFNVSSTEVQTSYVVTIS